MIQVTNIDDTFKNEFKYNPLCCELSQSAEIYGNIVNDDSDFMRSYVLQLRDSYSRYIFNLYTDGYADLLDPDLEMNEENLSFA